MPKIDPEKWKDLEQRRVALGLSQVQFAEIMGISRRTYQYWVANFIKHGMPFRRCLAKIILLESENT